MHVIEAGSAAASEGEREALRLISDAGLASEICTYVRAMQLDIDYAADFGADSVHLVIPVSDLHIEKKMRKTRPEIYTHGDVGGRLCQGPGSYRGTLR